MIASEAYNGPTGGHGEPSSNQNTDYIICDTCKRKLYPDRYTSNGWLKE